MSRCDIFLSPTRRLTNQRPQIFDEYTRRQYLAKAPSRNPFGRDEEPANFNDFDVFTKIRVLQQLSTWTLGNAERIRGLMPADEDHLTWRMEPLGWDKEDRAYYVLDDNRLYRRSDRPVPPPSPKPKHKAKRKKSAAKSRPSRGTRSSKRRKVDEAEDEVEDPVLEEEIQEDTVMTNGHDGDKRDGDGYGFTSETWECIAVTLEEYNDFLATLFRSRDPNERQLRNRIEEDVLPVIAKRADALRAKQLKKMRELDNLQRMAGAKRSSRLAGKAEKEKEEREVREAEEKRQAELKMAHEERQRQQKIEEGHESRRLTREQRLKEREVKRILHEEELAKLEEQANGATALDATSDAAADYDKRISQRQLKTQKEQHQKELEKLAEHEDMWVFDCAVCGMHGENLDDGSHSIACERCNVWQHSKCHGISPAKAEKVGFHFICSTCKRKEADAKKPKIPSLKLGKRPTAAASTGSDAPKSASPSATANGQTASGLPEHVQRQLDAVPGHQQLYPPAGPWAPLASVSMLPPHKPNSGPNGVFAPSPVDHYPLHTRYSQQPWQGSPGIPPNFPPPVGYASPSAAHPSHRHVPSHYQQHQQTHQSAVLTSGGHPYQPPSYHPQPNTSPAVAAGGYSMNQQHPPRLPPQQPQLAHWTREPRMAQQQRQGPPSGMNGRPSPAEHAPQSLEHFASPTRPPYQSHASPPQTSPLPMQNPVTRFRPPTAGSDHPTAGCSPVKSSPMQGADGQQQNVPTPSFMQTPQQNLRPGSANGVHVSYQTPQHLQPSPASANANAVAADGMSGPWPESSTAIPQKHDQGFAMPGSQNTGVGQVLPPVSLAPSPKPMVPGHGAAAQVIPQKKRPDANAVPDPPAPVRTSE